MYPLFHFNAAFSPPTSNWPESFQQERLCSLQQTLTFTQTALTHSSPTYQLKCLHNMRQKIIYLKKEEGSQRKIGASKT